MRWAISRFNLMRFRFTPLDIGYADLYEAVEHSHEVLSKTLWDKKKFKAKAAVT